MPRLLLSLGLAVVLSACASGPILQHTDMMRGFNAMQDDMIAWDNPQARASIDRMVASGANAVVFITFLKQAAPNAVRVEKSDAVTDVQLSAAIAYARKVGLKVILKPQMLVGGSWAGDIDFDSPEQWHRWFESYSRHIIDMAEFAARHKVDVFMVGTELRHAAGIVDWPVLIRAVRSVFHGQLSYAAHNVKGVRAFPYWHDLDAVSLTLYPSLGASGSYQEMQQQIDSAVQQLQMAVADIHKPLWVLEIGMPSARGASAKPWAWQHLKHVPVDLDLQEQALALWVQALDQDWVDGVFIWAWYSDVDAGGRHDSDYTPQNKPAESSIRSFWK